MTEDEARNRVEAFIADYHGAWQRSGRVPDDVQALPDFAAWERELAALVETHFTAGARTGAEGSLSGTPGHDPAVERLVSVEVRGAEADVHTVTSDAGRESHHLYRLVAAGDGWRINRIVRTFESPDTPLVDPAEVERLLASMRPDADGEPVLDVLASGMTALFSERFEVTELGAITTSGVLTAHDLGWVRFDVAPFHRRVPAGSYPVEVARGPDGTNVAVRVRFSDREAASYVPASRVDTGNVVSVDAANVTILDYEALASCSEAHVEELCQLHLESMGTSGSVFSLTGATADAAVVMSGYGDGGYPAFWGLAADGSAVDLVVDFLVAVEDVRTTIEVPFALGPVGHPDLVPHRFEVITDADGLAFRYGDHGDATVAGIEVVAPGGRPVEGREGSLLDQRGVLTLRWHPREDIPAGATLAVTLVQGYRHV